MSVAAQEQTLATGFLRSAARFPERPALLAGGVELTYAELARRAGGVAAALRARSDDNAPPLAAVLGARSVETFSAVLGALLSGHGYVPLNPRYPVKRNVDILERTHCRMLLVAGESAGVAEELVAGVRNAPETITVADVTEAEPMGALAAPEDPAYVLFTSGSTGRPKGVAVSHANARAFLDAAVDRYALHETDRLSQLFDLTFDLSVFDMFAAWEVGACVCCPQEHHLLRPGEFVRSAELTVWFSVPSLAMLMQQLGGLKPGAFPGLRLSLFCGEALPAELANAWALSAPNSVVENLYGPTEATIACTAEPWEAGATSGANGLVPIGKPFGRTVTRVVDESLQELPRGEPGQLLLSGPQVVAGYLDDSEATERAFVTLPGFGRGYLTGDRVVEDMHENRLEYLGRIDSQIKVLGHRVELEEIEAAVREEAGVAALAVGWPRTPAGAAGIVVFVAGESLDTIGLRRRLGTRLPDFMMPREIRVLPVLPLNANGKLDRSAVTALLESS